MKDLEKKLLDLNLQLEMKDSSFKMVEEELVKERESSKAKIEDTTSMLTRFDFYPCGLTFALTRQEKTGILFLFIFMFDFCVDLNYFCHSSLTF